MKIRKKAGMSFVERQLAMKAHDTLLASITFYMQRSYSTHFICDTVTDFEWQLIAAGALSWVTRDNKDVLSAINAETPDLIEAIKKAKKDYDEAVS